jgi:hypothetical protein
MKSDRDAWYGGQGKSLKFLQFGGAESGVSTPNYEIQTCADLTYQIRYSFDLFRFFSTL